MYDSISEHFVLRARMVDIEDICIWVYDVKPSRISEVKFGLV